MTSPRPARSVASLVAELLDRGLDDAELREATKHVAQTAAGQELLTRSTFIFRLGLEWFGLPTSVVDEVVETRAIHTLPHRREGTMRGLVNVRGQLTICLALEQLFQLGAPTSPVRTRQSVLSRRLVVVAMQGHRLAFEAEEVHGSHRFDPDSLRSVPATVAKSVASFTTDLLPWRDHTVGLLDAELLFHALARRLG
ncbi:MAG TPA: chemotaxis protein CheW [Rhodanobacter sp.]|nr:chemotaxis protein CheW [Rhodanobacter sp.]